jgi:hypothetical protein
MLEIQLRTVLAGIDKRFADRFKMCLSHMSTKDISRTQNKPSLPWKSSPTRDGRACLPSARLQHLSGMTVDGVRQWHAHIRSIISTASVPDSHMPEDFICAVAY